MKKILLFLSLFLVSIVSICGQTADEFKKKYGSEVYYEIRPKILMSAQFDKSGQVCRVSFQPNRLSKKTNTNFLGQDVLDLFDLEEAFEEIVPDDQRNREIQSNGFHSSGSMFFGSFEYENIRVGLSGSWRIGEKSRRVDFCKLTEEESKKSPFCSPFGTPEIVTVAWTKRTCIEE
jgi:hypothetical protein